MGAYEKLQQHNTYLCRPLSIVHNSLQYMNMPIQLLGNVLPHGTTKFSVKGIESYSVVNFSVYQNKMFAKCMSGICSAQLANKKKIPKTLSLQDINHPKHKKEKEKLCCHLKTVYENIDFIRGFFPGYFNAEDTQQTNCQEDVNLEDVNLVSPQGKFNTESGLWNFPAHSNHKPHEMLDVNLIKQTQLRNDICHSTNFNMNTGQYDTIHLKPNIESCNCGAGFQPNTYERKGSATVYSRNGPLSCIYYSIKCKSGLCDSTYLEEAKNQGIFFLSSITAVADEVGWDFISLVMKSKMSFRGFTVEMTCRYQTTNVLSSPFMSPSSFVKWFFAWLAAFKIDFREHVDPWCKHKPKIIAGDGTHIGVGIKNMKLEKSIVKVDDPHTTRKNFHKRYDRVLLPKKQLREHLKYLTKKALHKLKPQEILDAETETVKTLEMMAGIDDMGNDAVTQFIQVFIQQQQHEKILSPMAHLLYMLSGDAPLSSVVPFRSHPTIHKCINEIHTGNVCKTILTELKHYSMELSELFHNCILYDCDGVITQFVEYLIMHTEEIHQLNHVPEAPTPIPGSYNPPSGTVYYFSQTGEQVIIPLIPISVM